MRNSRTGHAAINLLVALLVIIMAAAILMSLSLPTREFANLNDTKANLKHLAQACRTAEVEWGHLPPAWGGFGMPRKPGDNVRTTTAFVHLLPYLEQRALFDAGKFSSARVKVFWAAMDPSLTKSEGHTSFVANLRVFSEHGATQAWNATIDELSQCGANRWATSDLPDGAEKTILFTTKYGVCNGVHNLFHLSPTDPSGGGPFFGAGSHAGGSAPRSHIPPGQTRNLPAYQIAPSLGAEGPNVCNNDPGLFGHSFGGSGLAVAMADTAVRNLSFAITGDTFAKALCPNDGLALGNDW